jgi:hypothetical protein
MQSRIRAWNEDRDLGELDPGMRVDHGLGTVRVGGFGEGLTLDDVNVNTWPATFAQAI